VKQVERSVVRVSSIVLGLAVCWLGWASVARAAPVISVDGDLTDWGVNLQLVNSGGTFNVNGQTGPYTTFVPSSFTPSAGIDFQVTNDDVPASHGGELFDAEAIYAYSDATNIHIALVTSSNVNGTRWDGYGDRRFGPGDVKITTQDGLEFGLGARPLDLTVYGRISEIWGPYDARDQVTWDSISEQTGDTYYKTTEALVAADPTWSYVNNPGADIDAYFVGGTGTPRGYATAAWRQWSDVGDYYEDDSYGRDEPYGTWIFEAAVPRSMLGFDEDSEGTLSLSFFSLDCGNDTIAVEADFAGAVIYTVPEPATASLFAMGVFGLILSRRRRQGPCQES